MAFIHSHVKILNFLISFYKEAQLQLWVEI